MPKSRIFVAGISSESYMAVQMHVAYSGPFKSAAVYAGGPNHCAQDSLGLALTTCSANAPPVNAAALVATTRSWAQQGLIDPVTSLRGQSTCFWSGVPGTTVRQPLMDAPRDCYGALGAIVSRYDNSFLAEHGWESPCGPQPCGNAASPYVVTCYGYDKSGATCTDPGCAIPYASEQVWLTRWLSPPTPRNTGTLQGSVAPFDQGRFVPGGNDAAIGMDRIGHAFARGLRRQPAMQPGSGLAWLPAILRRRRAGLHRRLRHRPVDGCGPHRRPPPPSDHDEFDGQQP